MTQPAVIAGDQSNLWSVVLASVTENVGAEPEQVWQDALTEFGSDTRGPDGSGEYSSQCPCPTHNGTGGDQVASLRWRVAPDGTVLLKCQAGCDAEDVVGSLGLTFVQLRWSQTHYHYRNEFRELLATHVRMPLVGGKKKFWWQHEENGTTINNRGPAWEPVLWCLPDLRDHANAAHEAGKPVHAILCEGERDVINVTDALEASWYPSECADHVHLITTSADGAASWATELSTQLLELAPNLVTILCDSDETGMRRGSMVAESLLEYEPTLDIAVLSWSDHASVKDATIAIERFGRNWLKEAHPATEADPYLWCSVDTGWMYEAEIHDLEGQLTGKRALHRMAYPGTKAVKSEAITKWPVRVVACTLNEHGDAVGWELDLGLGGSRLIRAQDLIGSGLETWNASVGLFVVPTRGLGPALRAYLGHHGQNCPQMAVWDHEGWVDDQTFVTGNGILIGPAGLIGRAEEGATEWHYGEAETSDAVRILGELLTFRPLTESAPVLSWLAAVAIRPKALEASGASFVPMLQVPGDSGTGKTSFLKLATRLFGLSGAPVSNVTTAGLVRTLALSTQHVWIDDFANYDDTVRDIIRGGLTGAGRTRGTTTSERGIVRDEARAALINSGETAMGLEERAMRQRSVVVPFTERAQGRVSRRAGATERGQYADMVEMGVDRDDHGTGLSRWAGTVVRALWDTAAKLDPGQTVLTGANDGVREAAAWRFVEYGATVLAEWMRGEGFDADKADKLTRVTSNLVADQVRGAERREKSGADIHLITTLVPAYLHQRRQTFDTAVTGRLHENEKLDAHAVTRLIRDSWRIADAGKHTVVEGRPARGVVLIVAPGDGDEQGEEVVALALCASALAEWAGSDDGRRAGIGQDRRFVTKEGIGMQVAAVSARGDHWRAGGARAGAQGGAKIRVKLNAAQAPQYSVVTDSDVIRAVLG